MVCVSSYGSSTQSVSAMTLGGSAGNFTQLAVTGTTSTFATIWADPNCAGGQTSVAITGTNLSIDLITVYEVSGLAASSVLDKTASTTSAGTSWSSGTTATTTQASEIWIGCADTDYAITAPGSPWTTTTGGSTYACSGYQIVSSTGTATFSGTQSSSGPCSAAVVTLKASSGQTVTLPATTSLTASGGPHGAVALAAATTLTGAGNPAGAAALAASTSLTAIGGNQAALPAVTSLTAGAATRAAAGLAASVTLTAGGGSAGAAILAATASIAASGQTTGTATLPASTTLAAAAATWAVAALAVIAQLSSGGSTGGAANLPASGGLHAQGTAGLVYKTCWRNAPDYLKVTGG